MATYLLLASEVPAVQVPASYIDPADGTPTISEAITAGETTTGRDKVNRNAARIDALGQVGAGGPYGVQQGTGELTAGSGLTANISAALVRIDGPLYCDAQTYACSSGDNYLWLNASGSVVRSGTTAVPSGGKVYLGRVTASGGGITAIDYSGRAELRSGVLWRQTADEAQPLDTPPEAICFYALTTAGLYVWDGTDYHAITGGTTVIEATLETVEFEALTTQRALRRLVLNLARTPLGPYVLDEVTMPLLRQALLEA